MHVHEPMSQVEDGAPFLSLHVVSKCYASWCNLYRRIFMAIWSWRIAATLVACVGELRVRA